MTNKNHDKFVKQQAEPGEQQQGNQPMRPGQDQQGGSGVGNSGQQQQAETNRNKTGNPDLND